MLCFDYLLFYIIRHVKFRRREIVQKKAYNKVTLITDDTKLNIDIFFLTKV
jgi:hypothetical protein